MTIRPLGDRVLVEPQEEKEQVFAAHNIRLSAGAILIEQITVSEIQHLELTVKRNDKQTDRFFHNRRKGYL